MSYRYVTMVAEALALKLARDWESAPVRPRESMLELLADGYIWLPDVNDGEIVDLVREIGLLGAYFLYETSRWASVSPDGFSMLRVESEEEVRSALAEIADAFSEPRVHAYMTYVHALLFESTVEDVLEDILSAGAPVRFNEVKYDLSRLLSVQGAYSNRAMCERASAAELALLDEVIRVGNAAHMRLERLLEEASWELLRRYGESYLRRRVQSGQVGRVEIGQNETIDLREALQLLCADGDPAASAVVDLARQELDRWSALALSEVRLTAHRTVQIERLEDESVRELRLGKAAALMQRELEQRDVEAKALPIVLPVLGELPIGLEPLKVELYLGEACEQAYREATAAGIHSCMANEDGIKAMGRTARGLDRSVGVLLFRKAHSNTVVDNVVARCRVYVAFCTDCGRTMTFADRLYVGDTRYTSEVEAIRSAIVDRAYPNKDCPECDGVLAKLANWHDGKQPYEDTFNSGSLEYIANANFVLLTSYIHNWGSSRYTPEEAFAAITSVSLEESLRARHPELTVITASK